MKRSLIAGIALVCTWGCQNIEDASPSTRSTYIKSYEGPFSYTASAFEKTADGFIVMGTMQVSAEETKTVVFKTDPRGNRTTEVTEFTGLSGKGIKSFTNTSFSGYIIVGDSIKINPTATQGGNIEVSSMQLLYINEDLVKVASTSIKDTSTDPNRVLTDFAANAVTVTSDNRILVLGTYEEDGKPIKPLVVAVKNDLSIEWMNQYNAIDLDYINGKSIHYNNGNIIWASSILSQSGNFSDSYITIPFVKEPLTFKNYSIMGQSRDRAFFVNDIQPARAAGFGYGIVGTDGNRDGTQKNVFFTRVDTQGTISSQDTLFLDAVLGVVDASKPSQIEDTGDAITSTSDGGFVLAGTITSVAGEGGMGKGGRDILLIKISAFGQQQWVRTIGGAGDESVTSVVEASDGGIVILGTNNIGNYSSIFLIKTNSAGELLN